MPKSKQDAMEVNAAVSYSVAGKTIVMVIMTMVQGDFSPSLFQTVRCYF